MTLEVSSFQLEADPALSSAHRRLAEFRAGPSGPLPGHGGVPAAKLRIFENQTGEDFAVINLADIPSAMNSRIACARGKSPSAPTAQGGDFELRDGVIHFRGEPVLDNGRTRNCAACTTPRT